MLARRCSVVTALAVLALVSPRGASAQGGPSPEVRAAIQSIVQMLEGTGDSSLHRFATTRLAPTYRASMSDAAMLAHLRRFREATGGSVTDMSVERTPDGMSLNISGEHSVTIDFALDDQFRVTRLALGEVRKGTAADASSEWNTLSWDSLDEHFQRWEAKGFNGVVLARRGGKDLLRRGYGFADTTTKRRSSLNTIYGIGSTPIDFTVMGILMLGQRGRLALDDTIGKFLPGVPADKRTMTLQHLMSGGSGLPDFHDIPSVDWDADLAWIDRETAMRRILAQPLLFVPGKGDAHSHSAYGLLAAVIEIVSEQSYRDFVQAEIFTPLGMTRTGFYGDPGAFRVEDFAVGTGPSFVGLPNIPPNWGPTSWLVMGSGGMFSTLDDMTRFYEAGFSGRLLSGQWARHFQGENVDVGGSNRGFFIFHVSNIRGDRILGLMNGEGRAPDARAMVRAAERVVTQH